MMGKKILKESFEMDRKQMCVRTKQISPGVYKTISRGFIRALSGHYRVPIGTILIPDMDSMIVRTEWGSVYWRSDPLNNWWIGWVLPNDFSFKETGSKIFKSTYEFFSNSDKIDVRIERDGTMWLLQIAGQNERLIPKWRGQKILKFMLKSNEVHIPIVG